MATVRRDEDIRAGIAQLEAELDSGRAVNEMYAQRRQLALELYNLTDDTLRANRDWQEAFADILLQLEDGQDVVEEMYRLTNNIRTGEEARLQLLRRQLLIAREAEAVRRIEYELQYQIQTVAQQITQQVTQANRYYGITQGLLQGIGVELTAALRTQQQINDSGQVTNQHLRVESQRLIDIARRAAEVQFPDPDTSFVDTLEQRLQGLSERVNLGPVTGQLQVDFQQLNADIQEGTLRIQGFAEVAAAQIESLTQGAAFGTGELANQMQSLAVQQRRYAAAGSDQERAAILQEILTLTDQIDTTLEQQYNNNTQALSVEQLQARTVAETAAARARGLVLDQQHLDTTRQIAEAYRQHGPAIRAAQAGVDSVVDSLQNRLSVIPPGLQKFFGIDKALEGVRNAANEAVQSFTAELGRTGDPMAALTAGARTFGITLNAALGPIGLILVGIAAIGAALASAYLLISHYQKKWEEISKDTGLSLEQSKQLHKQSLDLVTSSKNKLLVEKDVLEIQKQFIKDNGVALDLSKKGNQALVISLGETASMFGYTNEEAAQLHTILRNAGMNDKVAANMQKTAALAAEAAGIAPSIITKDLIEGADVVATYYSRYPKQAAAAAIQTRKLGMSLKQAGAIADKMLDIDSFMTDMFELSAMTRGGIDLSKAFDLRMSGADPAEVAAATLDAVGTLSDFNKQDEFVKRKLAETIGMTTSELQNSLRLKEMGLGQDAKAQKAMEALLATGTDLDSITKEQLETKKQELETSKKMDTAMAKMSASVEKALLPVMEALVPAIDPMIEIVMGIFDVFQGVLAPVIKDIAEMFKNLFGEASGSTKIFKEIGKVLGVALVTPLRITLAIFSNFVNMVSSFAGGVRKLFSGDIFGGLLDIGEGVVRMLGAPIAIAWEMFKTLGVQIVNIIGGWFGLEGAGGRLLEGIKAIGPALLDLLTAPFKKAWDWITGLFGGQSPSELGLRIVEGIAAIGSTLLATLIGPFEKAWDWVLSLFSFENLGTKLVAGFKAIGDAVVDVLTWPFKTVVDFVANLFGFGNVGTKIIEGVKSVKNVVVDTLMYPFKFVVDSIGSLFTGAGQSIVNGLLSVGNSIQEAVTAPFRKAWDWVSSLWGGQSPSEVGLRIAAGIQSVEGQVQDALTSPFKQASEVLKQSNPLQTAMQGVPAESMQPTTLEVDNLTTSINCLTQALAELSSVQVGNLLKVVDEIKRLADAQIETKIVDVISKITGTFASADSPSQAETGQNRTVVPGTPPPAETGQNRVIGTGPTPGPMDARTAALEQYNQAQPTTGGNAKLEALMSELINQFKMYANRPNNIVIGNKALNEIATEMRIRNNNIR